MLCFNWEETMEIDGRYVLSASGFFKVFGRHTLLSLKTFNQIVRSHKLNKHVALLSTFLFTPLTPEELTAKGYVLVTWEDLDTRGKENHGGVVRLEREKRPELWEWKALLDFVKTTDWYTEDYEFRYMVGWEYYSGSKDSPKMLALGIFARPRDRATQQAIREKRAHNRFKNALGCASALVGLAATQVTP